MNLIWAALSLYAIQWAALPFVSDQWTFLIGMSCLTTALLVSGVSLLCRSSSLSIRSALVLWAISAWADLAKFMVWSYSDTRIDLSVPLALMFVVWLLFLVRRKYNIPNSPISQSNVTLLLKRPYTIPDLVKGLFGAPVPSVCVCINSTVWSFRRRSGMFETSTLTFAIRGSHIAIDTGVPATADMVGMLNSLVGEPRGTIPCKCLWTIRDVLNMIGGKYAIKSWLDYVPGFYVIRVL